MAFFLQYAWLIPVFPLLACVLITFVAPIRRSKELSGWLAIGMMVLAAIFALGLLAGVAQGIGLDERGQVTTLVLETHAEAEGGAADVEKESFVFPLPNVVQRIAWAPTGSSVFEMGFYIDPASAVVLVMVTITSACIHLFSLGYMAANARQARFFSFVALFTAAMLAMTMAGDLLLFFMAWEIMGLCSYLLIGFLFERPSAYRAALKAFITTRIGDVLMLIGMVYLYTQVGSLQFGMGEGELFNPDVLANLAAGTNALGMSHATAISLLIFAGTVGKAAQFPLHVWLPDAMEGPTPVSALIHAATMVSAGVFLLVRVYPVLAADDGTALYLVSFIGGLTALFAATIATAQFDIKRILAYSTLSQLGFMVAALGIGGWVAGLFHMLMHAFFKALLFLGSGSVIHAMEATPAIEEIHHRDEYAAQQTAQDIRNMGGLRQYMPATFWTYTVGYLALAGIFPLAGFWSKDEILADAFKHEHWVVWGVLTIAAFLTAFYMTRQWWTVFFGSYRGDSPREWHYPADMEPPTHSEPTEHAHVEHGHASHGAHGGHGGHGGQDDHGRPHESPWTMTLPLAILAVFAALGGLANLPGWHWLSSLWGQPPAEFSYLVGAMSLLIALAGVAAGWALYRAAFRTAQDDDPFEAAQPALFGLLNRAFAIDRFYAHTIGALTAALAALWSWIDRRLLTPLVNGVGHVTFFLGRINFIVDDTLFNDGPDAAAQGTNRAGDTVRQTQTGRTQDYLGLVFAGVVVLALIYLYGVS